MSKQSIFLTFGLIIGALIVWYAIDVFLLAFAAILFAIFLNSVGNLTKKIIHVPYTLALIIGILCIIACLTLIFWLYTPLIAEQFQILIKQLPGAAQNLSETLSPYINLKILTEQELTSKFFDNQKVLAQLTKLFSFTLGSIVGFIIFIIVGFYLAVNPKNYMQGVHFLMRSKKRLMDILAQVTSALRWWLMGKLLAMISIGILTFVGLWLLNVSLAFILGFLAGLLAFIPYIGPILSSIPAILIGFTEGPLTGLYVILLYLVIHALEGYLITPYIEQKTVSIPPALTIMTQILFVVLVGGLGLALATPLTVVAIALLKGVYSEKHLSPSNG